MSKEIRIGLLAVIAVGLFIWGYKFLLGTNILSRSSTYYVEYRNIDNLQISDPVMINGYQIGTVKSIYLKPENLQTLVVVLDVENDIKLPANTVAELRSEGMMGGKLIHLTYSGVCENDCLQSGDHIPGLEVGFIQSMVDPAEIDTYMKTLREGMGGVLDSLSAGLMEDDSSNALAATVTDLRVTVANLRQTTYQMNQLFANSSAQMVGILNNVQSVTRTLQQNNEQISGLLQNVNEITGQLASARLDTTIFKANDALASTGSMMESLETTLAKAEKTFAELQGLLGDIQQGKGTLGSLAKDPDLYDNLNHAMQNLDLLLQDFRLNPKRYVNVSVFGKKQKDYTVPEEDPAFDTAQIKE